MSKVLSGLSPFESPDSSHGNNFNNNFSSLVHLDSGLPDKLKINFSWEQSQDSRRGSFHHISSQGAMDVADEYQRRLSTSQRPSSEQLPPLSSIFQNSHTTILPVRTPHPRRSPSFPAVSSRTNQHVIISGAEERRHQDPSYENPHHSQTATPSYPFGRSERPEILHPSRTLSSGSVSGGSGSSHLFERRWSPRASEPSSSDYFPRNLQSISSPHKPYPDTRCQLPLVQPATKLPFINNRFNASPQLAQYQLGSPSTAQPKPSSTKDSLGPKIWTGTQFLPRFVKQQEVPGEGLCYFYDDGSHCKPVIDGEVVNAHWGVTKAGKPRKRLAIACITCRERKIKCDPDCPRCVQCEKFGRHCKFKNAPRGASHESPETASPTETEDFMVHESNLAPNSRRAGPEKEEAERSYTKRRKNTFNAFTPVAASDSFGSVGSDGLRRLSSASETSVYFDNLLSMWHADPFETNAAVANHLMAAYFAHINSGTYCIFPEQPFMRWLRSSCNKKSLDDHMLIYSMLALGTVFSGSLGHRERGREFAKIGRHAVAHRPFSIQLVQSRLLLSLYFMATGDNDSSSDLCGAAMCTASSLQLNLELDELGEIKAETFPYGLTRHGYAECRRRTYWSLYIMDRFNGVHFGNLCIINPENIFLRLPSNVHSLEAQMENTNPYFDLSSPSIMPTKATELGAMASLIAISSIWGDVMANIYRSSFRQPSVLKTAHTNFHNATTKRLESWEASLPPTLQYSKMDLDRSRHEGIFGTFITIHVLYHTTQIKLNRYYRTTCVSPSQLEKNIRKAYTSAKALLAITDAISETKYIASSQCHTTKPGEKPPPPPPSSPKSKITEFSAPFLHHAIISAVDLITAKGRRAEIPELMKTLEGAKTVLGQLETFWHGAGTASRLVERRMEELEALMGGGGGGHDVDGGGGKAGGGVCGGDEGVWESEESIEAAAAGLGRGVVLMDGVYRASWGAWGAAMGGGV